MRRGKGIEEFSGKGMEEFLNRKGGPVTQAEKTSFENFQAEHFTHFTQGRDLYYAGLRVGREMCLDNTRIVLENTMSSEAVDLIMEELEG